MNSPQRVLAALNLQIPDRVPWVELAVTHEFASKALGNDDYTPLELGLSLGLDGVGFAMHPPCYVEQAEAGGRSYIRDGLIHTESDLSLVDLPSTSDPAYWDPARRFVDGVGGRLATFLMTNIGWDPVLLSMGLAAFSYALADNPELVRRLLDMYTDWAAGWADRAARVGADFVWFTDDVAYNTGPMFSPAVFAELFLPAGRKVARAVRGPWCFHSDGDLGPLMDALLSLGMNAVHPFDPGGMDIEDAKRRWGRRVCLIGNIDLRSTLTTAAPQVAYDETAARIRAVGRGGGYIVSSANCLAAYCNPENVRRMRRAIEENGWYDSDGAPGPPPSGATDAGRKRSDQP